MPRRFVLIALALALSGAAWGAPVKPRPDGGCGVLALRPQPGDEQAKVVLYQEPGLSRLAELDAAKLPRLAGSGAEPVVTVTARKGAWTRVAYDEAGREGWLEQERSWRYLPWQEFLPGKLLQVLPGLKKGQYGVRSKPGDAAAQMATLARDQQVRVLRVEDDWALLEAPMGWFRWRDGDGRLTVSLAGD